MYETGLGIAFLLWAANMVNLLVTINSQMERNLNKIGMRSSWTGGNQRPIDAAYRDRPWLLHALKFVFFAAISLPFVLASWLYVAWVVGSYLYQHHKDAGAPQGIKEYRWKLKNRDMTFDQIIREGMKAAELDLETFDEAKEEVLHEMRARGFR